ncbi:MAG: helix-hairpin-helix domain-containing protein [Clostridiaceae bacterium]|nr:helix-hairpin-helix domain-containing protein [Clostridiaceae bacterium]
MEIRIKEKIYKLPWEYFIAPLLILLIVVLLIVANYSNIKETWIDFSEKPIEIVTPANQNKYDSVKKQNHAVDVKIKDVEVEGDSITATSQQDHIKEAKNDKININKAGLEELMTLPYIGEVKAKAIMEYRKTYGAFSTVEELINVKGIGAKTLERLRPYIIID